LKYFATILLFILAFSNANAQPSENVAPVKWETYSDRELDFSIALPKLPTRTSQTDVCSYTRLTTFFAYAEDAVYRIKAFTKGGGRGRDFCSKKTTFASTELFDEILKTSGAQVKKTAGGISFIEYRDGETSTWVFNDVENNRLFDLAIFSRNTTNVDAGRFVESLTLSRTDGSKSIGEGARQILGDASILGTDTSVKSPEVPAELPFKVIWQPRAEYTTSARQAGISGGVVLKIQLMANGAIGNVVVIKELSHGLTEQSVKAARSIVFIPKKLKGSNVDVVVTREYTFRVY
jgi:TonB family protein